MFSIEQLDGILTRWGEPGEEVERLVIEGALEDGLLGYITSINPSCVGLLGATKVVLGLVSIGGRSDHSHHTGKSSADVKHGLQNSAGFVVVYVERCYVGPFWFSGTSTPLPFH
jgi:hypothetical protein